MMYTYKDLESIGWNEILANDNFDWQAPVTVHFPIQPVHSADFIHVDAGLGVCRRRVYPDMSIGSIEEIEAFNESKARETFFLQFFLDDPPFIPDFKLSNLTLPPSGLPVVSADYFAWDMLYQFKYFSTRVDENGQTALWVEVSVTNESMVMREAHVRAKLNFNKENDLFDYHYVPYFWDNSKCFDGNMFSLVDDNLAYNGNFIGFLNRGDFKCDFVESASFKDSSYNKRFACATPYFVTPSKRLKELKHSIHAQTQIAPGETKKFSLRLLVDYEHIRDEHIKTLSGVKIEQAEKYAVKAFEQELSNGECKLSAPQENWEQIFNALSTSSLQLLVGFPGTADLTPTQGGTSERHFVWVWEAVNMLLPMVRLGHYSVVRKSLDFIFKLQDGGFPPEGDFSSFDGAIGTTGPKWANSTGSALMLAARYYLTSHDEQFLKDYLDKIIRAGSWIINELKETRKLDKNGQKPDTYGLMPFCCATDADIGHVVTFTDSYTYCGLNDTVSLLKAIDHPKTQEFQKELELYKENLLRVIQKLQRKDGFIERKIISNDERETFLNKFERICGAPHLVECGILKPNSNIFNRYLHYFENNLVDGLFMGKLDREVFYIGMIESVWHKIFLARGEWKKAFAAYRTVMKYGMTRDTFQTQERFSKRNPAYTCWQPNGSGNGRMLDMLLNNIIFEYNDDKYGDTLTILGGIRFADVKRNCVIELKNLNSSKGKISLRAEYTNEDICKISLKIDSDNALPKIVRIPDFWKLIKLSSEVISLNKGFYCLAKNSNAITFFLVNSDNS